MRLLFLLAASYALAVASTASAFPIVRVPKPTFRNPGGRVLTTHVDLELEADDTTKVRTDFLPEILDENGKPKRYTKDEVAALKGDSNLPGFKATYDNLKPGQIVRVRLGPKDSEKKDSKDDIKKDDNDKKTETPKPIALPVNELAGKVTSVEGTTKKLVVRVDIKTLANPIVSALNNANNANNKDKGSGQDIPVDRKVKLIVIETPDPAHKEKK
jgi:hypothetical protein